MQSPVPEELYRRLIPQAPMIATKLATSGTSPRTGDVHKITYFDFDIITFKPGHFFSCGEAISETSFPVFLFNSAIFCAISRRFPFRLVFLTLQYSLLTSLVLKDSNTPVRCWFPVPWSGRNVISHLPERFNNQQVIAYLHTALKKNKADIKKAPRGSLYYFVKSSGAWSVRICSATLSR